MSQKIIILLFILTLKTNQIESNLNDDSMFKIMENLQKLIFKDDLDNKLLTINSISGNKGFKGNFVLQQKKMLIWTISILNKNQNKNIRLQKDLKFEKNFEITKNNINDKTLKKKKNFEINKIFKDKKNEEKKNVEIEILFGENIDKEFIPFCFKKEYLINFKDNEVSKQILMFYFKFNKNFMGEIDFKFENDLIYVFLDKVKYVYKAESYLNDNLTKLFAYYNEDSSEFKDSEY